MTSPLSDVVEPPSGMRPRITTARGLLIGGGLLVVGFVVLRMSSSPNSEAWTWIGRVVALVGFVLLVVYYHRWRRATSDDRTMRIVRTVAPLLVILALFWDWLPLKAHPLLRMKPEV